MSMPSRSRSLRPSDTIVSPLFWAFNSRNVRVAAAMAVASIFACEGQRKDPRGACVDKDARASVQGGAGRDHVVDKENAALRVNHTCVANPASTYAANGRSVLFSPPR